jgi:hypothetical protein
MAKIPQPTLGIQALNWTPTFIPHSHRHIFNLPELGSQYLIQDMYKILTILTSFLSLLSLLLPIAQEKCYHGATIM